jgi:hypothetical protein
LNVFPRVIESTRQQSKRVGTIGRIWKHRATLPQTGKASASGLGGGKALIGLDVAA